MEPKIEKTQLNLRISGLTEGQLAELMQKLGVTKTELVTVAVDRMYREEVLKKARKPRKRSGGA